MTEIILVRHGILWIPKLKEDSMAIENVICPRCGRETLATVPSDHRLVRVVENAKYDCRFDKDCVTQYCRCSKCNESFGAVTREQF